MKILKHHFFFFLTAFIITVLMGALSTDLSTAFAKPVPKHPETTPPPPFPTCVYIASYAPGYFWQDEQTRNIQKTLDNVCQLHIFYMDTKPIRSEARLKQVGQQAQKFIQKHQPDIILASDDNAMKYVVKPYYKNSQTPVVFCGINNTGKPYGLPYRNTTGMIEKLPFDSIIHLIKNLPAQYKHNQVVSLALLTTNTATEKKNIQYLEQKAKTYHINFTPVQVHSLKEWHQKFIELNQDKTLDFIILGNYQALKQNWSPEKEAHFHQKQTQKLTFSYLKSMHPYTHLTFLKSATEQGLWAANTAKLILQKGYAPSDLQMVPNRQFQILYNQSMIQALPAHLQTTIHNFMARRNTQ